MSRFQILSLTGGGIRGAFVTSYLRQVEAMLGRPIVESFDLIAGTSTGAIIAAGLASGLSAEQLHEFYVHHGAKIFEPRPPYRASGVMRFFYPAANWVFRRRTGSGLDAAFRSRFCPQALEEAFSEGFGSRTMGMVEETRLIVPVVNLTRGRPHVFRSRHLPKGVHDEHIKISDVLIAATAAPTYFPHHQIDGSTFVDGGLWAADPSMLALAESMRLQHFAKQHEQQPRYETNDIHLLSIGTGRSSFSWTPPGPDAGLLYWALRVGDVMTTAQVEGIHLPLRFLLSDRYRHINFDIKTPWGLDAVENMPALFRTGKEVAEKTFDTINGEFLGHKREKFIPFTDTKQELLTD